MVNNLRYWVIDDLRPGACEPLAVRTSGRARAVSGLGRPGPVAEEGTDLGDFLVADAVRETGIDALG